MRRLPFGWFFPALAIVAAAIAVWSSSVLAISVPATAVAVLAAALLIVEVSARPRDDAVRPTTVTPSSAASPRGAAFDLGPLGRQEILVVLDHAERVLRNPDLGNRSIEEIDQLGRMSPDVFRAYVRSRLDDLERDA